jgi:hypothetical protein
MVARTHFIVTLYVHCLACYQFSDCGHPSHPSCTVIGDKRDAGAPCRIGAPVFRGLRTRSSLHVRKKQLSTCLNFATNNAVLSPSECHWSTLSKQVTLPCAITYKGSTCSTCWRWPAVRAVARLCLSGQPEKVSARCNSGLLCWPTGLWYFRSGMLNSWSDRVLERN